jgi:predicted RNase H-like HicB family nuclease
MTREISVIIERGLEGPYVGAVPAFRGRRLQARSSDELMIRIREAS